MKGMNIIAKKITYEEWSNRVDSMSNNEFKLIEVVYEKSHSNSIRREAFLYIRHKNCNHIFKRRGGQWLKTQSCPKCSSLMKVSYLHAVVSILFDEYYEGVVFEKDIGFKGDKGYPSRYDLFIPCYNDKPTLIEFQSRFHDDRECFDKRKMEFAESHGYVFYSFDHRDHLVEDVVTLLFPNLKSVPSWVKTRLSLFQKPDLSGLQTLLDRRMSTKEIAEVLKTTESIILNAIRDGVAQRKDDHMKHVYNIKPIIQLDLSGNFIKEYSAINQVKIQAGINPFSNLQGKSKHAGGYLWLYKSDYINGNYEIPDKNKLKLNQTNPRKE